MKNGAFAKKQSGFFLTELGVALVLFSVFSGIWLYQRITAQQEELRLSSAKQIGETAKIVDDALKTYTTKYFTLIQRGLPITAGGYTVPASRVSSPSMADLVAVANMRPQAASAINYFGQSIGFSASIQVDTSDGCSIPACNLIAIVSSTAPISLVNDSTKPDIQMATIAANTASAANAGVALPESPAVFSGVGGVTIAGNASGEAGRIAIRNGYDSSGMSEFLRRDGSLPMTGDLRMKDDAGVSHSINEAKSVGAETVTTTGRLTTGEFIKLGGTAVEGQACAENGLVAKDAAGLILSCQSGRWEGALSSSDNDYLLFGIRGDSGWIKNNFGRTVHVSASGGTAPSNRCDVHGHILEIGSVAGAVDANDSWSKGCSISFAVPKGFSFKITSYPYNYGAGNVTVYLH